MILNEYGKTGIKVSAVGFGGMRFPNDDSIETCAELVQAAYDAGINYFDTAPGYGRSEDLYGEAFKEMLKQRDEKPFYVSTKTMKDNPEDARRDLETSLKRMGLDYVDFYHFWCVMSLEAYQRRRDRGVLKEFEKMKDEGLIRHVCVSTHMHGMDIGTMLADYPFEGVLMGYSAMNFAYRTAGIDAAVEHDQGVVVMNPLGGGAIPRHPERFDFVRTREDESVVEGALRFLFNDPRITVALVGLGNQQELQEALKAVDGFEPLPADIQDKLVAGLKRDFNELCTGCAYCDKCPHDIPVPGYMEAYNHMSLEGKPMAMINRLRWHWGIKLEDDYLDRCSACGACEAACTQKLPIIERLESIKAEIKSHLAEQKKG